MEGRDWGIDLDQSRRWALRAIALGVFVLNTGCGDGVEDERAGGASVREGSATGATSTTAASSDHTPQSTVATKVSASSLPSTTSTAVSTSRPPTAESSPVQLDGVVVHQFWGVPGVEEAGWLLVDVTGGGAIDGSSRVALYVPFDVVRWCGAADAGGYYKLVSTLPVQFVAEPLVGGEVPYPDGQPPWQGVPRRNAGEVRACPVSGADAAGELSVQRAKWEAAGVRTYRFTLSWMSMVAGGDFAVSVVDGRPAGLEPADPTIFQGRTDEERDAALSSVPASIDEVFDALERVADAERFEVTYDPQYGFPTTGRIDDDLSSVDDEFEFRVSDLRVD